MPSGVLSTLALLVMVAALFAIPIGLPGLWIMVATTVVLALSGLVGLALPLGAAVAALVVETAEFYILKRMGQAWGGSRKAFWGAVFGGMMGLFVGLPVPLVGPLITAFLGTFAGALAVTWWETRHLGRSARVGWGMLLARVAAVGLKVGTGVALVVTVALALVFRR